MTDTGIAADDFINDDASFDNSSGLRNDTLLGQRQYLRFLVLMCLAGFFLEFKPSEPFLTPYLIDIKKLTEKQLNDDVYPVYTYAYFAFLIPCGLLSEFIGFKWTIVLGILSREITRILLIFSTSLTTVEVLEITFGFACAAQLIFYSYVYRIVPKAQYQQATSCLRAVSLFGHVLGAGLGQLLVHVGVSLKVHFIISFVSVSVGFVLFFFQPDAEISGQSNLNLWIHIKKYGCRSAFSQIALDFSSHSVRIWSLWWWLGLCVLELVLNYNTVLWYDIDSAQDYNGLVLAIGRLAATLGAIIPSLCLSFLAKYRSIVIVTITGCSALFLLWGTFTYDLVLSYIQFVIFYGLMEFLQTTASAQIAASMSTNHYGVLFSFNTFISVGLQVFVQLFVGKHILHYNTRAKYFFFSCELFFTTAVMSLLIMILQRAQKYSLQDEESELATLQKGAASDATFR